jgi:hypothetical protein
MKITGKHWGILISTSSFRYLIILFGCVSFITACSQTTPSVEPSITPNPPTETPIPPTPTHTATPIPTDTPTLPPTLTETPSPTIDLPATAAFESTQEAQAMLDEINPILESVNYSTQTGYLAWSEIDPWPITSSSYGTTIFEPIDEGTEYKNYVLHYDVIWESTSGLAGCGLIFHSEKNLGSGKQYRFYAYRFSGLPYWTVELWNYNWPPTSTMGRGKINSAINQDNGSKNTFTLVVREDVMTVYANDIRLSHVPISTLNKGRIAFFAFQESGETTCAYENAWLWNLDEK